MSTYRKVPSFYGKDKPLTHYLASVFALVGGLFIFVGLFAPKKSLFDYWLGCYIGPFAVLFLIVGAVFFFKDGSLILKERRNWFKNTATAETTIVDRQEIINDQNDIDYAYSYGQYIPRGYWYLILESIPSQLAIKPEEMSVSVSISESQYKKYANRNKAQIYYSKEDPFVFLLEDEV